MVISRWHKLSRAMPQPPLTAASEVKLIRWLAAPSTAPEWHHTTSRLGVSWCMGSLVEGEAATAAVVGPRPLVEIS